MIQFNPLFQVTFLLLAFTVSNLEGIAIPISSNHGGYSGSSYGSQHGYGSAAGYSNNHGSSYTSSPYTAAYKSMKGYNTPHSAALTSNYGSHHPSSSSSPFSAALMSGYGSMSGGYGGSYYDPYAAYETAIDIHGPGFY